MAVDAIKQALERATTWPQARRLLREALFLEGWAPDDALLDAMLVAGCGGDLVAVDATGAAADPLARKHAGALGLDR